MSSPEAVRQQALGILAANNVPTQMNDDGSFTVPAPGEDASAIVIISVAEEFDEAVVALRSPAVSNLKVSGRKANKVYELLNTLNANHTLVKWAYYPDMGIIGCEYDLLGDHMQESELMTALLVIAQTADAFDEGLIEEFGDGERAMEPQGTVA